MSRNIFISYRRDDSMGIAGRLYDRLEKHFGRDHIFMDTVTIKPGMDFIDTILNAVEKTDVFLVIIGPDWLDITDDKRNRRLENPEDFVRLEISAALEQGKRIIPVLVHKSEMPQSADLPEDLKALVRHQDFELRDSSFNLDSERLVKAIEGTAVNPANDRVGFPDLIWLISCTCVGIWILIYSIYINPNHPEFWNSLVVVPISTIILELFQPIRWIFATIAVSLLHGLSVAGFHIAGYSFEIVELPIAALIIILNSSILKALAAWRFTIPKKV